jgi:hypothetical protein
LHYQIPYDFLSNIYEVEGLFCRNTRNYADLILSDGGSILTCNEIINISILNKTFLKIILNILLYTFKSKCLMIFLRSVYEIEYFQLRGTQHYKDRSLVNASRNVTYAVASLCT